MRVLFKIIKKIKSFFWTFVARLTLNEAEDLKANGYTKLSKNTHVGHNCHFNGLIVNGVGIVRIGNNFHSGENCRFITSHHNYNGNSIPYDSSYITQNIVIEDNVWLGRDVTILGGVKIGEGAIIQVGSVVVSDIPPLAIAGGHPAVVFKYRNAEKYKELLKVKAFH